jgi:hypothetical protein
MHNSLTQLKDNGGPLMVSGRHARIQNDNFFILPSYNLLLLLSTTILILRKEKKGLESRKNIILGRKK